MRIGDNKVIPIDVRVIAATNKNLYNLVLDRKFREDLFYRLNVLKIEMPSLRNKKEDIPSLMNHFIQYYSDKLDKPSIALSEDAVEYLCSYDWPGNVRELRNFVERLMVVAKKAYFELGDIEGKFITAVAIKGNSNVHQEDIEGTINENNIESEDSKGSYSSEREAILQALKENKGIINFAAEALGISRTTLWRKMKKYNLDSIIK